MPDDSPILSQKLSGAYFTPADVAQALVAWALRSPSDRLLDPSCGDGQFLALHRHVVGIEQKPMPAHAAIERAPWPLVHEGDFFAWAGEATERFECAAASPPLIRHQQFKGEVRRRAPELLPRLQARCA